MCRWAEAVQLLRELLQRQGSNELAEKVQHETSGLVYALWNSIKTIAAVRALLD